MFVPCANIFKSDDDYDSPEPSSTGRSSRIHNPLHSQQSIFSRRQSRSQTSPPPSFYTPETEDASPVVDPQFLSGREDTDYKDDSLFEDATQIPNTQATGYLGQICEVKWLWGLKSRLQKRDPVSPASSLHSSQTNFYLDEQGIQFLNRDNPFHLPPENLATVLFQCYFQTVHITFPIIPSDIQNQLQIYYNSVRGGHVATFPQRWYAIVNLIFAIGARFSHLVNAEWHTDVLEETLYISRAYQLLGLNDTAIVLTSPDLSLIQVSFRCTYTTTLLMSVGFWAPLFLSHGYRSRKQVSMSMTVLDLDYATRSSHIPPIAPVNHTTPSTVAI
jgi:hypothetical protein